MEQAVYLERLRDPAFATTVLLHLYKTPPGFLSNDKNFLSSLAEQLNRGRQLSVSQYAFAQKMLAKYNERIPNDVIAVNGGETQKQEQIAPMAWCGRRGNNIICKYKYPRTNKGNHEFAERLKTVKSLNAKWDDVDKVWTLALSIPNIKTLKDDGFVIADGLRQWAKDNQIKAQDLKIDPKSLPTLAKKLRPFQEQGVAFAQRKNFRVLFGDEMGLGKTCQSLASLELSGQYPAVVVCPASLKINWQREINAWLPKKTTCILGGKKASHLPNTDIFIINYDVLNAWLAELRKKKIQYVIFDEVQYIKTRKAGRTKAAIALAEGVPCVNGLSGTPIENKPIEFFTILNILDGSKFKNLWPFAKEFCGATYGRFGWDFNGATNIKRLHELLTTTVMIRRLKSEVLKELPPKVRTVVPLEIDNRKTYTKACNDFLTWVKEEYGIGKYRKAKAAEAFSKIEYLKQLCFKGKMAGAIEWITNFLDTGNKLVVFTTHREALASLRDAFSDVCVTVEGGMSPINRQKAVDGFQNDKSVHLFLGQLKAAGVGLTLTAASSTCFVEFGWNPSAHDQAEDRVHRIGQTDDSVNAYYLVGVNTIDEYISEMIDYKRKIVTAILDGEDVPDENLLSELISKMMGG